VLNYLSKVVNDSAFAHTVLCLDYANRYAVEVANKAGFPLFGDMWKKKPEVLDFIDEGGLVVIPFNSLP
jgi:hypothetical protein